MKEFRFNTNRQVATSPLEPLLDIDRLELASVSMNFEPERADKGHAILSVILVHRATGHKVNVLYQDASALAFWKQIEPLIEQGIFDKLAGDGKLPPGTVRAKAEAPK